MNTVYTCEGLEVTINGTDWVLNGSIERVVTGIDDDGEELVTDIICAEAIFPVITTGRYEEVSDRPLESYPVEWKNAILDAILDQAQADQEKRDEERANR